MNGAGLVLPPNLALINLTLRNLILKLIPAFSLKKKGTPTFSNGFPCFRDSGDRIARPYGRISTVVEFKT
mgnify:CR=1 FL=1